MARTLKEGLASVRGIVDVVWGNKLTQANGELDTGNYASGDYLHTGLLTFQDVYFDSYDCNTELLGIVLFESDSTLLKPDFQLLLFNECDIAPVKNSAFAYTSETTYEDIIEVADGLTADYVTLTSSTARYLKIFESPRVLKQLEGIRDVLGLLKFMSSTPGAFQTSAELKVGLIIRHA